MPAGNMTLCAPPEENVRECQTQHNPKWPRIGVISWLAKIKHRAKVQPITDRHQAPSSIDRVEIEQSIIEEIVGNCSSTGLIALATTASTVALAADPIAGCALFIASVVYGSCMKTMAGAAYKKRRRRVGPTSLPTARVHYLRSQSGRQIFASMS